LAEPASIFDTIDEDALLRAIEEGRADIAAGRVVSHQIVVEWLEKLARGERVPPPIPPRDK